MKSSIQSTQQPLADPLQCRLSRSRCGHRLPRKRSCLWRKSKELLLRFLGIPPRRHLRLDRSSIPLGGSIVPSSQTIGGSQAVYGSRPSSPRAWSCSARQLTTYYLILAIIDHNAATGWRMKKATPTQTASTTFHAASLLDKHSTMLGNRFVNRTLILLSEASKGSLGTKYPLKSHTGWSVAPCSPCMTRTSQLAAEPPTP